MKIFIPKYQINNNCTKINTLVTIYVEKWEMYQMSWCFVSASSLKYNRYKISAQ